MPAATGIAVHTVSYAPGHIVLQLAKPAPAGSALVVSENYYPGWKATADGKAALVVRTDYSLMGVVLPAGRTRVELTFTSAAYERGKMITLLALALSIVAHRGAESCSTGGAVAERALVIIPTYNERDNIATLLEPDSGAGSAARGARSSTTARRTGPGSSRTRSRRASRACTCCIGRASWGSAPPTSPAFRWALERDYEYVFEMDADFSHDPAPPPAVSRRDPGCRPRAGLPLQNAAR